MQAASVITAVRLVLSPAEADQLRAEIGQLELNGSTELEKLYLELRDALDNTVVD